MASLHCETRAGRKLYRLQFRDGDKRRKSIRLGSLNKRSAEAIRCKVEALVSAKISGQAIDADVARWVVTLGRDLSDKRPTLA